MIRCFRLDDLEFCVASFAETQEVNFPGIEIGDRLIEDLRLRFESALDTPGHTVLVYDDRGPRGFIWYAVTEHHGRGSIGHVNDIFVAPEQRGRGVGEALMRAMEQRLAAQGVTAIELTVSLVNPAALRLYRKLGYEVTRYRMAKKLR